jgi:hypothetical protein
MRCWPKTDECKARGAANSYSIGKPSNAAGAIFGRNPKGRGDLGAFHRCSFLVWSDQTASLAPRTASQIATVAQAKGY